MTPEDLIQRFHLAPLTGEGPDHLLQGGQDTGG